MVFTSDTLMAALKGAGFATVELRRRAATFDLWAVAAREEATTDVIRQLMADYLPATA